jgi:hypothetical protein
MHIVYFGQTPTQGTGSPITMLRHLQRMKAGGHRVSIIGEWGQSSSESWTVHHLPHRRFWWPPFVAENRWLRGLRMRLWADECGLLLGSRPDAVLTYLSYHSELLSEVAAHFALHSRRPLSTIIHDDVTAFRENSSAQSRGLRKRYRWILNSSNRNWFVSKELSISYGFSGSSENLLLPIPEGNRRRVEWRAEFSRKPLFIYSGHLCEPQYPLLSRLARVINQAGGHLLLISRETPALRDLCGREPMTLKPLLPSNSEALDYVAANATAFLAAYCDRIEDMPWVQSSFPSKVVEFSHLGLPTLFVNPTESAIYRWNEEHRVPANYAPTAEREIREFVVSLKDRSVWQQLASTTWEIAQREFDPESIHARLMEHLI